MAPNGGQRAIDLIAVLLITRSRPGPKLVFHYPLKPEYDATNDAVHDTYADSEQEFEDDVDRKSGKVLPNGVEPLFDADLTNLSPTDSKKNPLDHVLGYSVESLEKLLSPGRWCDRKKFEVCVNGLSFIGHPIYASEDGKWSAKSQGSVKLPSHKYHDDSDSEDENFEVMPAKASEKSPHDFTHIPESLDSQADFGLGASASSNSTTSAAILEQMAMFHVVFVMRTFNSEDLHNQVTAIHRDIVKKLSKAMHYCQAQSNYVASESQKLLSMIATSRQHQMDPDEMWLELVENSELAWTMKELYDRISCHSLATVRLSGMEISLLTSSHMSSKDTTPSPFSALLLLEPKESLLRSLAHPDAAPLAHFVREHTPTKNLLKHSANLSMPLSDILYLAQHLLKWRKARLIAPLHQRNIYIVNPSFDLAELPKHLDTYARAFPTLPPLSNLLRFLSGKPLRFGLLIPSRDHRGPYMEILAFLVRNDLVVQLQTFGWLRLPSSPEPELQTGRRNPRPHSPHHPPNPAIHHPLRSRYAPPSVTGDSSPNLLSPHLRPSNAHDDVTDNISVASDHTAIPLGLARTRKRLSAGTQLSVDVAQSESDSEAISPAATTGTAAVVLTPSSSETGQLLLDPVHPSRDEARRIATLRMTIDDAETREHFEALLPFFDGKHAFEGIAARLQVKRAKVEEWLGELDRRGRLMVIRHI